MALSPGEVAYIPDENAPLRGLAQVQQDLVRSVAARGNSKRATVDLDTTIQESRKREAKPHYEGGRGYQAQRARVRSGSEGERKLKGRPARTDPGRGGGRSSEQRRSGPGRGPNRRKCRGRSPSVPAAPPAQPSAPSLARHAVAIALVFAVGCSTIPATKDRKESAAVVFHHGRVFGHPGATAVLVVGSRIEKVGGEDLLAWTAAQTVGVGGGLIVPGFRDSHVHLMSGGLSLGGARLDGAAGGKIVHAQH